MKHMPVWANSKFRWVCVCVGYVFTELGRNKESQTNIFIYVCIPI